MKKKLPNDLVRDYLRLTAAITPMEKELKPIKEKIIKLYGKGYTHPSLLFTDVDRRCIPWQEIVRELLEDKFAGDEARIKTYYKRLDKRFPREPIAPRIQATGK